MDKPANITTVVPEREDCWAKLVGLRASYYVPLFRRFSSGGRRVSWNWAAFFLSAGWLADRGLWPHAIVYAVLLGLAAWGQLRLVFADPVLSSAVLVATALLAWVVVPVLADWLYFRSIAGRTARALDPAASPEERARRLAPPGGAILVLRLLAAFGLTTACALAWLLLTVMPAHLVAEARVAVGYTATEAAELARAIQAFRAEQGRLPTSLSEVAWRDRPERAGFRELRWDAPGRSIDVVLRSPMFGGGELNFRPDDDGHWRCTAHRLDARLVPPGCRGER